MVITETFSVLFGAHVNGVADTEATTGVGVPTITLLSVSGQPLPETT